MIESPTEPEPPESSEAVGAHFSQSTFNDFGLPKGVQRAIDELGFTTCTEVQGEVLPHSLSQHDVCAQANTGTGKTAAFLATILTYFVEFPLDTGRVTGRPRALVLAPTRELALQIKEDFNALNKHTRFRGVALVGGKKSKEQREYLKKGPVDLVVATPGRLLDFMQQGQVELSKVEILVIDEADRMLDMGFIPTVRRIVRHTPHREERQTMFFSATFNVDVRRLIDQWMFEPIRIEVQPESIAAHTVDQRFWIVDKGEKERMLSRFMKERKPDRTLVFVNRRSSVKSVVKALRKREIACEGMAGDMPQHKRSAALARFKSGKTRHIVATDVAGRGLHIEGITHVINYDLPDIVEDYVHRIGRTGRVGTTGISISFVSEQDGFVLPELEDLLQEKLVCTEPDLKSV